MPALPGRLDGDDAEAGEAEQAEAGLGSWWAAMKKTGLAMPQPIVSSSLEVAPPAQRRQQRVVEGGAALEIGDLEEDVVQHRAGGYTRRGAGKSVRPGSAAARGPAEEADREQQAGDAPDRRRPPGCPTRAPEPPPGHVGGEEGLEEVPDREVVGEVDDAARDLVVGDEDAGEEVERQQQRVDDRRGGVLRGDRAVRAMPRQQKEAAPTTSVSEDRRQPLPGDRRRRRGRGRSPRAATSISSATTIELPTRPAMKTQAGIGVPRPRFRRPSSRAITSDIARLCIVAEITARVMIAGT